MPTILIVGENPQDIEFLAQALTEYSLYKTTSGKEAIEIAHNSEVDLILLDVIILEMNGFEVCACLKASPKTASIPVIFVSALSKPEDKVRGLETGAEDYIPKPVSPEEVEMRVRIHLGLRANWQAIEQLWWQQLVRFQEQEQHYLMLGEQLRYAIKNQVSVINLLLHSLKKFSHMDDLKAMDYIAHAQKSVTESAALIETNLKLLNASAGTHFDIKPFAIMPFVERLITLHQLVAEKKGITIRLMVDGLPANTVIAADQAHISSVLANLLDNAVKYSFRGGKITVALGFKDQSFRIDIRDTGWGIPAADLARVFERNYRVAQTRGYQTPGNGLGLYIAKSVVEHHGGSINVSSEIGKGSQFTILLPQPSPMANVASV